MFEGDVPLIEELNDQDANHFGGVIFVTTNRCPNSNDYGNKGQYCTLTRECQNNCRGG